MEPVALFKLIKNLESDLAEFYAKLKNITMLSEFIDIFDLMEKQSRGHASKVEGSSRSIHFHSLDTNPIYKLHNEIKNFLFDNVSNTENVEDALSIMADSEEIIGKMYQSIANHFRNVAADYFRVVEVLEEMSADELCHRDSILKKTIKPC